MDLLFSIVWLVIVGMCFATRRWRGVKRVPIVIVGIVINFQLIMISSSAKIDRSSALHLIDKSDDRRLFMLNWPILLKFD